MVEIEKQTWRADDLPFKPKSKLWKPGSCSSWGPYGGPPSERLPKTFVPVAEYNSTYYEACTEIPLGRGMQTLGHLKKQPYCAFYFLYVI